MEWLKFTVRRQQSSTTFPLLSQKINEDQPLCTIDVLHIAASLLIFTHSINNLRLVNRLTNGQSLRQAVNHQARLFFTP